MLILSYSQVQLSYASNFLKNHNIILIDTFLKRVLPMTFIDTNKIVPRPVTCHHNIIRSSWVEVDTQALAHNIARYKEVIKPAYLAAVIKSNAYGHGIEQIALLCEKNDVVDML